MPTLCKIDECIKNAIYNLPGNTPKFCKYHKDSNMINTRDKKCNFDGCYKYPSFNFQGLSKKFCSGHAKLGMVNLNSTICTANFIAYTI